MMIIICAAFAATAAVFAALFFMNRKNADKFERRADGLQDELADLRVENARLETRSGGVMEPLNPNSLVEFIRKEKTTDVKIYEKDPSYVIFRIDDEVYHFRCEALPRFLFLGTGTNYNADSGIHTDIMKRAAAHVTDSLNMVKVVVEDGHFEFQILSTDRTVGTLRENFDIYMSILRDATREFGAKYWEIMREEHPEECTGDDDEGEAQAESQSMQDLAMKMAGNQKESKLKS